jgi:branched-chain amino acid transport system substrate-binding protein
LGSTADRAFDARLRRSRRTVVRFGFLFGLQVGLALLCPMSGRSETPIVIGAMLPLTGPGAVIGNAERDGIQFAVDQRNEAGGIDGHPIELLVDDHQGKPAQAVLYYHQMVDLKGTPAILSSYSGPTLALAPLAARQKVVLINSGAQADNLANASPYLFNTTPMIADEVSALVAYLQSKRTLTAAILYENDSAGISGRADFVTAFEKAGGKIVAQAPVDFGATDFRAALYQLAGAKPDVIFVNLTAGTKQLAQQYAELKLTPTIVGTSFFSDPTLIQDQAANGWLHTQVTIDAPPRLVSEFEARFHEPMTFHVRQWYNGTLMLLTAIEFALAKKEPLSGEGIRQAIFDVRHFTGLIPMTFDTNTAKVSISINRIQDGADVPVSG